VDEAVIIAANELGVASMPGTHTTHWKGIEERAQRCLESVKV
jgi:hypothetical protein